ncbi:MAG: HD-GYP domain-containing protein [Betaproteobacteria bacterium]
MTQKVNAPDIRIGMFIADLDRPWIDTPFLLQGFLVEDDDQLGQLRQYCQWVIIDPQRSVGAEFEKPVKKAVVAPRDLGKEPLVTISRTTTAAPAAPPAMAKAPAANSARERDRASGKAPPPPPSRAASREFAIPTKDSRTDGGNPAFRRLEGAAPSRNDNGARANGESSGRGLWGKLREGVTGLFARQAEDTYNDEAVGEFTPEKSLVRATFIPETVLLTIYEDAKPVEDEIGLATAAFQRTNDLLHRVVADIRAGNSLQLQSVEEVINDMVDSMVRNPDALMWVARMREQHLTVYDHGLSVAISLVAFGRHLGYPKEQLSQLGMMGLLLDIGKIKLPAELLEKNARLSSDEFEQIKEHVELGLDVLRQTPNIHPAVVEGIAQHHERMNGTGYPNNIMGEKISIFGRMAAIADTYAAVTKRRPYADAISPHEALQMLSNWSGTQFHADMVEQFIQSIGVFPVGSLVELSTGEVAVVVTHSKLKRLRPKVLIIAEADKSHCKHPAMRDLLYDVSDNPAYIRRGLPSNAFGLDPSEFYLS